MSLSASHSLLQPALLSCLFIRSLSILLLSARHSASLLFLLFRSWQDIITFKRNYYDISLLDLNSTTNLRWIAFLVSRIFNVDNRFASARFSHRICVQRRTKVSFRIDNGFGTDQSVLLFSVFDLLIDELKRN